MNLLVQFQGSFHYLRLGQQSELAGFLIVHSLGFFQRDDFSLLRFHQIADCVDTACSLGGIGIRFGHLQTEGSHRPLPGYGMVGHRVHQHAIHIKENGFGRESRKACSLKISENDPLQPPRGEAFRTPLPREGLGVGLVFHFFYFSFASLSLMAFESAS